MGFEKKRKSKGWKQSTREVEFVAALKTYSSNLYNALIVADDYTGYLKLIHREDGSWLALLGVWDNFGLPQVCFGNGATMMDALRSLTGSMSGNKWKDDKYAKPAPFL